MLNTSQGTYGGEYGAGTYGQGMYGQGMGYGTQGFGGYGPALSGLTYGPDDGRAGMGYGTAYGGGYWPGMQGPGMQAMQGPMMYRQGFPGYGTMGFGNYGGGMGGMGYGQGMYGQGLGAYGGGMPSSSMSGLGGWNLPDTWIVAEYWLIPGPFTGAGPHSYQRSDERIRDDVHERLTRHGYLDARNIQAQVSNGEVTLTGSVDTRQAKRMAADTAESVSGVKDVHNNLQIQQPTSQQMGQQTGQTGQMGQMGQTSQSAGMTGSRR
jgi:BON domain